MYESHPVTFFSKYYKNQDSFPNFEFAKMREEKEFPFFPDKLFKRIFVLYPDPWPKARHAERRFINQANLIHLNRLLADDGQIFVATDVAPYAEWAIEQVALNGMFEQVNADTTQPPIDWVPTRYEKKGIEAGRKPIYLVFAKKSTK